MKYNGKEKLYRYLQYGLAFLTFLFMTMWNYITPLWNDDEGWTRMSFKQIITSSGHDYLTSNGRFLGQIAAKSLANLPLPLEAILNAGIFSIVALLILKLSAGHRKQLFQLLSYVFVLLSIFLLTPGFSQIYLWRPGSGNYLWLMVIDLLFFSMFLNKKSSVPFLILLTLLGFITGTTNENTVGGIVIVCLYYLIAKKVDKNRIWPLVSLLIGYVVLLKSPGDTLRAHADNPDFFRLSLFGKIAKNLVPLNHFVIDNLVWEIVIFIILFSFSLFINKNKQVTWESLAWFIAGILTWYVLVISPGSPDEPQTYYGGFVLVLIANTKLFAASLNIDRSLNQLCTAILLALTFFTFINLSNGFIDAYRTDTAIAQREAEIIKQKNNGKSRIKVKPLSYYGKSKYAMFFWQFDITNDPQHWTNKVIEHRYNVKHVYLEQ